MGQDKCPDACAVWPTILACDLTKMAGVKHAACLSSSSSDSSSYAAKRPKMAGVKHAACSSSSEVFFLYTKRPKKQVFVKPTFDNGSMKTLLSHSPSKQTLYTCDLPAQNESVQFNYCLAWHFVRPAPLGYNCPCCINTLILQKTRFVYWIQINRIDVQKCMCLVRASINQ